MTEEEKKVIESVKELVDNCNNCNFSTCEQCEISWNDVQKIQSLLDLYNKQKETIINQEKIIMEQEKEINKYKNQEYGKLFNGRYISKEKIREKINYLESQFDEGIENYNNQFIIDCVGILDELLEGE